VTDWVLIKSAPVEYIELYIIGYSKIFLIMDNQMEVYENVLIAIRQIIRAIDLHSKYLSKKYGLTITQLIILKEVNALKEAHVGEVARRINLSQATVTSVMDRLEKLSYIERTRSETDKRKVIVRITHSGKKKLEDNPSLLQEYFIERFRKLKDWEQTLVLSALQRVASMMDAERLEVMPVLTSESVAASSRDVVEIIGDDVNIQNSDTIFNKNIKGE
jgi:DNA-binding MarR family transcriptional regulator